MVANSLVAKSILRPRYLRPRVVVGGLFKTIVWSLPYVKYVKTPLSMPPNLPMKFLTINIAKDPPLTLFWREKYAREKYPLFSRNTISPHQLPITHHQTPSLPIKHHQIPSFPYQVPSIPINYSSAPIKTHQSPSTTITPINSDRDITVSSWGM
jgi:hypothetical protein